MQIGAGHQYLSEMSKFYQGTELWNSNTETQNKNLLLWKGSMQTSS
jgi:hypothetical protein